jgi:Lon protease-like protein
MFPLQHVLLPGGLLPLHVFEERYRVMTRECLEGDATFGVVLIERGREVGGGDVRVDIGTTAVIDTASELADGRFVLVCHGVERFTVVEWLADDPYPLAMVEMLPDDVGASPESVARAETSVRRAWALLSELGAESALDPATTPAADAWTWCSLAPVVELDQLRLLRIDDPDERLALVCELAEAVAADARALLGGGGSAEAGDVG